MIDLEKMIREEVEKQLVNRGIASRSWVNARVIHSSKGVSRDEMEAFVNRRVAHHVLCSHPPREANEEIKTLQKQVKKLFAMNEEKKEKKESAKKYNPITDLNTITEIADQEFADDAVMEPYSRLFKYLRETTAKE